MKISCVDLFCGIGGLTYGLQTAGVEVRAGIDFDERCRWTYTHNTGVDFIHADVDKLDPCELVARFIPGSARLLAGCAPCQPFSTYGRTRRKEDNRWRLLGAFSRAVKALRPEFVTMENVPGLASHDIFRGFVNALESSGYSVAYDVLKCEFYGVPQRRRRLVLIASLVGRAALPERISDVPITVADAIARFPSIEAGAPAVADPMHIASRLSPLNLRRIRHSRPGGTWRDWPLELVADCHKGHRGKTYPSVYGRMEWNAPAPTITTQCHGYGNGRFGHPVQDRAISLREAAVLQSFPDWWEFVRPEESVKFASVARAIGNAVPPKLGEAIGQCILALAAGSSHAAVAQ